MSTNITQTPKAPSLCDGFKADIAAAQAIITKAQPLADKLAEMQAAVTSITKAQNDIAVLTEKLAEAETAERIRAQAVASYTVERIAVTAGNGTGASAAARHTVTMSRIAHGIHGPEPVTERYVLSNLSPDLLAVVVANADKIPACIRALDADPEQALRKHAQHVGRGYLAS